MSIFDTPKYDPLGSSSQSGATNSNKLSSGISSRTVRPGTGTTMQHTSAGMVVSVKKTRPRTPTKPSFWPELKGEDGKCGNGQLTLTMEDGYIILRKSATGDAVETLLPADIPKAVTPLNVAVGDKITCKIDEDASGLFTAAAIIKTSGAWPVSLAPELIGGDNASGTAGYRHIKLCEIINTDGIVSVSILNTGDISNSQPTLIENTSTSSPTTGGRVMKEFEPTSGKWEMRTVECDDGTVTFTEEADRIVVTANDSSSHPWKATETGGTGINVASGKVYWFDGNSNPLVMDYHKATAGSVTVTGTGGFIYYQYTTTQYQIQNETLANESLEGYSNGRFSSSGSFVFQSAAQTAGSGQDPNGITTVYILIAEVTLAGGVATIDEQVAQDDISPLMHYFIQGS